MRRLPSLLPPALLAAALLADPLQAAQGPSFAEIAAKLRAAKDRESYEAGAADCAKSLAALRTVEAMELRLELFDLRLSSYRGVFLRDWFYAGMMRAETAEESALLARAAADKKRSALLRELCLQALAAAPAPVAGELLYDKDFLRAPDGVRRAWQEAAGLVLAQERARFGKPAAAASARQLLLEAGAPYLGHAHLEAWTAEETSAIVKAAHAAKDPADRAEALRVLATRREQQAPFAAAAAVAWRRLDRAPRAAALAAAVEFDAYETAPALLDFLEAEAKEDAARWTTEAATALRLLTGMPFGPQAPAWRTWWSREGPAWLEARRAGAAPVARTDLRGGNSDTVAGNFFGLTVDSKRVAVVVDGSGSMSSSRLGEHSTVEAAGREVTKFCANLPPGGVFQLWVVETAPVACFPAAAPTSRANLEKAGQFLRSRAYQGTSAVVDALEAAMLDPEIDTIVFVGDGGSSAGRHQNDDFVLQAALRLHRRHGVRVHTVLVTDSRAHEDLMRALAAGTGGRMVRPAG